MSPVYLHFAKPETRSLSCGGMPWLTRACEQNAVAIRITLRLINSRVLS